MERKIQLRVCCDHFVSGKPAALPETEHVELMATLKLGHKTGRLEKAAINLQRHQRIME